MPRCFFVLVRPAAVVGERFALEEIRVVGFRLAHKQQRHFALQVHAFVVVPLVFGSGDAVAHKDDRRVEVRHGRLTLVAGYVVVEILQRHRRAVLRNEGEGGLRQRLHTDHRDVLKVGALVAGRLQPIALELRRNPVGRRVATLLTRATSFQFVAGKIFHRIANLLRFDSGRMRFLRQ